MSEVVTAVARAARKARLHELAATWTPALAAALVRTGRLPGALVADAASGLDTAAEMFAALAGTVEVESLVRAARAVRTRRARPRALGAVLAVAPELHDEVLALASGFTGSEYVFALVDGFPHLPADVQAAVLARLGPGLVRAGYAAQRIARGVRPEAFRVAWDVFAGSSPGDVTAASILTAAAPAGEQAALRAPLVARVCAGGALGYAAIRELLPHATGADRTALVDRALGFGGRYAAMTIATALGDAVAEPATEARFVAVLDAGRQDYPWDIACAYADVAARRSPNREACLARATALLDRMLDLATADANPYPMTAEAGRIPTALGHQVNALLAVTNATDGERRAAHEQRVLAWLTRVCPEHSRDDLVPIAWCRTAALAPARHGALLGIVGTIAEDAAAFAALAEIAAADPALESAALDVVMARSAQHAFPELDSAVATLRAPARPLSPAPLDAAAAAAAAVAPPKPGDPFAAIVVTALEAPARGVVAQLDALLVQHPRHWASYCRAACELAPMLETTERVAALTTISVSPPIPTSTPAASGNVCRRLPSMRSPFLLPRSLIVQRPSWVRRACWREIRPAGSSRTRSHTAPAPTITSAVDGLGNGWTVSSAQRRRRTTSSSINHSSGPAASVRVGPGMTSAAIQNVQPRTAASDPAPSGSRGAAVSAWWRRTMRTSSTTPSTAPAASAP